MPGRSAISIVEGEFETQAQAHVAIEPCGALAEIDAAGRVTLWSANQSVFRVQANVCEALSLSHVKVAVHDASSGRRIWQQNGDACSGDDSGSGD